MIQIEIDKFKIKVDNNNEIQVYPLNVIGYLINDDSEIVTLYDSYNKMILLNALFNDLIINSIQATRNNINELLKNLFFINYYTKEEADELLEKKADKDKVYTKDEIDDKLDLIESDIIDIEMKLDTKQDTLVSGISIKTINGNSLLGSGNLVIEGGGGSGSGDYIAKSGDTMTGNFNIIGSINIGDENTITGQYAFAQGNYTTASGDFSHAEGSGTIASGSYSHAEGKYTIASIPSSHAEGDSTKSNARASHSEGCLSEANGDCSHAEGNGTIADGDCSHAEGNGTIADGNYTHAEGWLTKVDGIASHAEGQMTKASSAGSHAEGSNTTANGRSSHAEGQGTNASGSHSHAEGNGTIANGDCSHAEGQGTITYNIAEHASGSYNISISGENQVVSALTSDTQATLFSIGNGNDEVTRKNAFEIKYNGDIYIVKNDETVKLQDLLVKDTLVEVNPSSNVLTLTNDKLQYTTITGNTTITLPTLTEYTEIHLIFNGYSSSTLSFTNTILWREKINVMTNSQVYELVFTYIDKINKWIAGYIKYE